MTITTGTAPRLLEPGIRKLWDDLGKEAKTPHYTKMFDVIKSTKKTETYQEMSNFGELEEKAEGDALKYQDMTQGVTTKGTNVAYAGGFKVTREQIADDQYKYVAEKGVRALRYSCAQTRERVAADFYANSFTSNGNGDGVSLINTAHPVINGTQSNRLAIDADLSEASLEDLLIQVSNVKGSTGLNMNLTGRSLIVSPKNQFEATRILNSVLQSGSANNDVNAIRDMGMLPEGVVINPHLTANASDAFFVRTDVMSGEGLIWQNREDPTFERDSDFDSKNLKYSVYDRYAAVAADWRSIFGSAGA